MQALRQSSAKTSIPRQSSNRIAGRGAGANPPDSVASVNAMEVAGQADAVKPETAKKKRKRTQKTAEAKTNPKKDQLEVSQEKDVLGDMSESKEDGTLSFALAGAFCSMTWI